MITDARGERSGGAAGGLRLVALIESGTVEFDLPAGGECPVGRTADAPIDLDDASVSRAHAVLLLGPGGAAVADRGSRNGTYVNGVQVGPTATALRPGDEVQFGTVRTRLVERLPWGLTAPTLTATGTSAGLLTRLAAEAERAVRHERPLAALVVIPHDPTAAPPDALSAAVAACLRSYDLIASPAGDALEVLLPECTQDDALRIARRMDGALRARRLPARVGVAAFPASAPSVESLLLAASAAARSVPTAGVGVAHGATRVLPLGAHTAMAAHAVTLQLFALVERLAHGTGPVLILGERGAGKLTVATALHALGPRAAGPLVVLDCAAVPEAELGARLLGVAEGARDGAGHAGALEDAVGGTLVLEAVERLPASLQAALLRTLQTRAVVRLGTDAALPVDVRVVATSTADLEVAQSEGSFRRDLHHRLGELTLVAPPLRARRGEIVHLARWFLAAAHRDAAGAPPTLSPGVEAALRQHAWRGNLDELRSVVEGALARCRGDEIELVHLPPEIARAFGATDDGAGWEARPFDDTTVVPLALSLPEAAPAAAPPPATAPAVAAAAAAPAAAAASPLPAEPPPLAIPADLPYDEALETLQRLLVTRALEQSGGAAAQAAALLGIERRRLTRLRQRLGLTE